MSGTPTHSPLCTVTIPASAFHVDYYSKYAIVKYTLPSEGAVDGVWVPVNKLELLAPYIGLTILLAIAFTTVVYVKKRKRDTEIISLNKQSKN